MELTKDELQTVLLTICKSSNGFIAAETVKAANATHPVKKAIAEAKIITYINTLKNMELIADQFDIKLRKDQ